MSTEVRLHRTLTVLLAVALLATLSVALTGGDRADAVEGPVDVVYVTTGRNFPDALAGGTLAATTGAPMLTVEPQLPIPPATVAALQSLDPDRIIIFGGPVAVSDAVRGALADHARSGSVTRIEGGDRHDTAAKIADALPSKVHDADRLDGLDSTQVGALHGLRDRELAREAAPTSFDSVRTLDFTAPTDGYVMVVATVFVANTDDASTNGTGVYMMYDWDGAASAASLQASVVAVDDVRLSESTEPTSSATATLTTVIPVTAGAHSVDLAMDGGTDLEYNAPSISLAFSPNGDASPVGVVVP